MRPSSSRLLASVALVAAWMAASALRPQSRWLAAVARLEGGGLDEEASGTSSKKKKKASSKKKKKQQAVVVEEAEEVLEAEETISSPRRRRPNLVLDEAEGIHEVRLAESHDLPGSAVVLTEAELERTMLSEGDVVRVHGSRRTSTLARVVAGDATALSGSAAANLGKVDGVYLAGPLRGVATAARLAVAVDDEDGEALFESELLPLLTNRRLVEAGKFLDDGKRWKVVSIDDGDELEAETGPETEVSIVAWEDVVVEDDEGPTYADVGGCAQHVETLREVLELPLHTPRVFAGLGVPPPKGALIYGPSGCGKTTLARAAAYESGAHVEMVSGSEIASKKSGEAEEALRAKFAAAEARAPAVIVIDEIETVGKKRDKASSENDKRVTSQLLTLMDGLRPTSGVVVLAATSRPNDLDPALRRFGRLDREIELVVPDEDARLEILLVKTRNLALADDVDLRSIANDCHGFVGADIAQLCTEAALLCVKDAVARRRRSLDDADDADVEAALDALSADVAATSKRLRVKHDHFARALKACNPASLRESAVEVPDVSWDDVGGLDDVKQELRETVEYPVQFAKLYNDFGLPPSKGVLFYGPPGCGTSELFFVSLFVVRLHCSRSRCRRDGSGHRRDRSTREVDASARLS